MFLPLLKFSEALSVSGFGFLLVLAVLAVLAILVKIFFDKIPGKAKKSSDAAETQAESVTETIAETTSEASTANATEEIVEEPRAPHIPGYVVLDGVSEQDAAVLMAITSYKTGIEIERLAFNSIKRLNQDPVLENVEEQDAAVIMAITSDKTGIPLEKLMFNSIKLVEE